MAAVYLGVQEAFDRKVAIKILTPKTTADEEFAARFLREAKTVAQLSHANIIPVYDFGSVDGYYYMSMEYLPGGTLGMLVKTGLELDEALRVIEDIASALHFAHSKGLMLSPLGMEMISSKVLSISNVFASASLDTNLNRGG